MYIGFITGILGDMPLEEKAKFAHETGYKALEISSWPRENERDYAGSDLDIEHMTQAMADDIRAMLNGYDLTVSSLAYYDNNLDRDPARRAFYNGHTKKVIDAASMLGVPLVGTFVGRDISKGIEENFDEFEKVFTDLVAYAESKHVGLMIENCHMPDWLEPGKPGTISYSPELWREMFRRVPSKNFGLNYDPSHLHILRIDYIKALEGFEDRVMHLHAKDAEVFPELFQQYGVYNAQLPGSQSFWRYRMPGLGQVDWKKLTDYLKAHGYDSVISVEHEDPLYEGSLEKIKEGLTLGYKYLKEIV